MKKQKKIDEKTGQQHVGRWENLIRSLFRLP